MSQGFSNWGYFTVFLCKEDLEVDDCVESSEDFSEYSEAMASAQKLSNETDRAVFVHEAAVFKVGRSKKEETILFWWNRIYANFLGEVSLGRGHGLYFPKRGLPRFVDYEPDPDFGEYAANEDKNEGEAVEDEDQYAKGHCDTCGKIVPLYELQIWSESQEAGRVSGSSRTGRSSSSRTSSGRYSFSSGSSSSSSSGRTYYRAVTSQLCSDCYKAAWQSWWIWIGLQGLFYAAIGALVLYWLSKRQ